MANIYKLIWTAEAVNGLKEIINYLESKFSEKEVQKFIIEFDKQLTNICSYPGIFPKSTKYESIRRCVAAKLTSIYYMVNEDTIVLISIRDNRKNS